MHCAACQARVEKAVSNVDGVESAAVSLLTNTLGVTGKADEGAVIKAIEDAGYGATPMEAGTDANVAGSARAAAEKRRAQEEALEDRETPVLRRRLISSVAILLALMYVSMGHSMLVLPLPEALGSNPVMIGMVEMLLAGIVMMINGRFFTSGFGSLARLAPNMDSLVAMGSMTSFLWSLVILFRMTAVQTSAGTDASMEYLHQLYFESAAMIVTLITVGKLLEAISKGKTTDALKSLLKLSPKTALVETEEGVVEIPVEDLKIGDMFICRAGDIIPVDGEITEGETSVDESALTGESIPVDKEPGDPLSAGTINSSGFIRAKATRVGEDTTLAKILQMVSDASATKAPIARIADKVSAIFVPVVIGIAALVILIWIIAGAGVGYALARGISVLVISCPCALGLATPVAIMVGSGVGARKGILFKTAQSLEMTGKVRTIALDKTGTITKGVPLVTDVMTVSMEEEEFLSVAFALEKGSEHPLGKAVVDCAQEKGLDPAPVENIRTLPGRGIEGSLVSERAEGEKTLTTITGGSRKYIETVAKVPEEIAEASERLAGEGKTILLFAKGKEVMGLIAVADTIKEDSRRAIGELKNMGIEVMMLTGDQEKTAAAIAKKAGIERVAAEVLPGDKEKIIGELRREGPAAMVGDGINDAPALISADTGIAIGAGADVAIDAADVVVMDSNLTDVAAAVRLSRKTIKNVRENLFWAFFYNVLLIPLAAGAYTGLLHGWTLNPMLAAAAMSLSSFCVCMNALRLNLVDIYDSSGDRKRRLEGAGNSGKLEGADNSLHTERTPEGAEEITAENGEEERNSKMKKTMKIEGMMCPHCEATVKKALEEIDGVAAASADHEKDIAEVELVSEVEDEVLRRAVEDKDYSVISID